MEAARDRQQPDFLPLIATALSSLDSGVWESLLHDSTSPKLLMQRVREEVLSRGLGVVGMFLSQLIFGSVMCRSHLRRLLAATSQELGPRWTRRLSCCMLCVARTCCSPSRQGLRVRTGGVLPSQKRLISVAWL